MQELLSGHNHTPSHPPPQKSEGQLFNPDTHLFLHAPTTTTASRLLLSNPHVLTSPRIQRKSQECCSEPAPPFCKAGGKGVKSCYNGGPSGPYPRKRTVLLSQIAPQSSTSMDPKCRSRVHPSPGACCPLVTSTLTCRRKSSNYQTNGLETGLRKPQVWGEKWEGKKLIFGGQL